MVPGEESILSNLRRGALEYCVLALLRPGARYGLDIARALGANGILMSGEGTLYPLLARLRKAGLVETTWQESSAGPPRRYYALTQDGERALATFTRAWHPFRDAVDAALEQRAEPT
ncbi:PadR family transcriptional regulator [Georgenia sp. EYE_87]|uniref:PadR family transcriptional regulator n=1 Tax=Georgenia sp. EYE_87 TaxID=2853448 RepID=UPI002003B8A1|nr:PadR family transcriptional regulator [Georgenia sp. EYE_87]MCK6211251.1 PadR family transcriptional regulator [Georgenia sp. EYE_87]